MMDTAQRFGLAVLGWACTASLALAQKAPEVRLDAGTLPGSSGSLAPKLASAGSAIYAIWEDERNGGGSFGPTDIYFNRSLDGGESWLPVEVRLDTGSPAGMEFSFDSSIAASGSAVHVAYADGRNLLFGDIYLNRSLDAGTTWLPADVRVDHHQGFANSVQPEVASSGSAVYVAWEDDRNSTPLYGPTDIYFNRSLDGGVTWVPVDLRLDTGKVPGSAYSLGIQMAASGSAVYVVWQDSRNSVAGASDVYFNRSLDNGTTWLPTSVRVDLGDAPGAASSYNVRMAAQGSAVYVTWVDHRSGSVDIYFNRSLDGGTTWLLSAVRLDVGSTGTISRSPAIAAAGSSVFVAWEDFRNRTQAAHRDIYFNRSLDGGATWLPADVRLNLGIAPGTARLEQVVVAAESSTVQVAWVDGRNPFSQDIYLNRSLDAGSTWLPGDVRLDVGTLPGSSSSLLPQLTASGSSVYAVWEDRRDGLEDIYFNLALGYQRYGAGTPGAGGFVPSVSGSGTASIGGTASIDVTNGRGGALCAIVFTFAGRATIPSIYGPLLLQPPWASRSLILGGTPGTPGAGSTSVLGAIPNDLALIGRRVNFQAAVYDTAAMGRLALSNGLELWVL